MRILYGSIFHVVWCASMHVFLLILFCTPLDPSYCTITSVVSPDICRYYLLLLCMTYAMTPVIFTGLEIPMRQNVNDKVLS